MSVKVENFLERLQTTQSLEDLQTLIEHIRDDYGVEHVVYHSVSGTGEQFGALTYAPEWVDHYLQENYSRIDPVVLGALRHFDPMDWKRLDWSNHTSRALLGEAIGAGLGNQGYSLPIRGPNGQFALFTVNQATDDDRWQKYTRANAADFLLLSHYVHERANTILGIPDTTVTRDLSPREHDAIAFLGMGESRSRIAEKMHISEHTLRVYIDSARYKLGAANTTHAVALAVSRGVVVL